MTLYSTLVFIHILLFVFWLGTDIGVFLAAKISERSDLGVETRATVLKLGMVLDRLPRSAVILIVPTGLQLGTVLGQFALPGFVLPAVWVISLTWLAVMWAGFLNPETALEKRATHINFIMHLIAAPLLIGYSIYLFLGDQAAPWLAIKVLMVGLIYVTGIVLDVLFKPAVAAFVTLVTQGATPERDAAYSKAIGPVYTSVLAIYAFVLIAAYLGTTKPVF